MSFGRHNDFNSKFETTIKKAIHKAEKTGKKKFTVEHDAFRGFSTKELVGQILHWKISPDYKDTGRHGYDKRESKFLMTKTKKIWVVTGIIPTVYHEKGATSGHVKRSERLIIEQYVGKVSDYLPVKKESILDKEFYEEVHRIGLGLLVEGRYCLKSNGDYGRILKIAVTEVQDDDLTKGDRLKKELMANGVTGDIIDTTGLTRHDIRGKEIEEYIKKRGFYYPLKDWDAPAWQEGRDRCIIESFVIIDDDEDMLMRQADHYVGVDGQRGFIEDEQFERALKILNTDFRI